ncbi:MAG: pyrroline-5-carboxylate reductase [Actinomycetota bacterium]|nr:pyrroline-5-carboxylate reductase [Actinomycetota bacterium]MDP2287758.1 pyrroline-5-carboxylate reductase [Actinomycetota bacterium]
MTRIAVLGGGVMGEALIAGLLQFDPQPSITVVEKLAARAQELTDRYSIQSAPARQAVSDADVVIAVVKPQDMREALSDISDAVPQSALVISIAAGITTAFISSLLPQVSVVRAMPNTPARIQRGVIGISAGVSCAPEQFENAAVLLGSVGLVLEIPEEQQDAITATSGSGPAYLFYLAEAMMRGAEESGLSADDARAAVVHTLLGSAELLAASSESPSTLRTNVTSPNGTTAAAIAVLNEQGVSDAIVKAMLAARDRSQELASS